mmetsp:Transcript_184653/g.585686  ORF Transcript_184653/g.585686 Transcript_184653/m.585686 type:complete len:723 (-) Transcript_184653:82-2250(-)
MKASVVRLAAACVATHFGAARSAQVLAAAEEGNNPIRRVVDLLWQIKKTVEEEGAEEEELFNKYMCFCKTGKGNLAGNIQKQNRKSPKVKGSLGAEENSLSRIENEIEAAKQERIVIEEKVAEAKSMREQEAAAFRKESAENQANIGALGKAVKALAVGVPAAAQAMFLQTEEATVLHELVTGYKVNGEAREALKALLQNRQQTDDGESLPSDEIVGVLKRMKATFEDNLAKATKDEEQAQVDINALVAASRKEAKALSAGIEAKLERSAKLKVNIVETEDDQESTVEALNRDESFMAQMLTTCDTLEQTYDQHKKMRMEELTSIADTIKLLGSDEAQVLRGRSDGGDDGGAASFLQVRSKSAKKAWRKEALRLLRAARSAQGGHRAQLDLLALALRGKRASKGGFDKILGMIEDMIGLGRKEQAIESDKADHCRAEMKRSDKDVKEIDVEISGKQKEIEDNDETLKTLASEILSLGEAIKHMDLAMAGSTEDRKANHALFVELMASNKKAVEVLNLATNRLMQFYNPNVAKFEEPKLDDVDDAMNPNQFGPGAMHMMRGMTGLVQESEYDGLSLDESQPPMPPNGGDLGQYTKANVASAGALTLIEKIKHQVVRDSAEAEVEEKNHAASYQMMLGNAKSKRATIVQELMQKQAAKARIAEDVHRLRGKRTADQAHKKDLFDYRSSLEQDCTWLLANFDKREAARKTEEDSLRQAKDVLSGV